MVKNWKFNENLTNFFFLFKKLLAKGNRRQDENKGDCPTHCADWCGGGFHWISRDWRENKKQLFFFACLHFSKFQEIIFCIFIVVPRLYRGALIGVRSASSGEPFFSEEKKKLKHSPPSTEPLNCIYFNYYPMTRTWTRKVSTALNNIASPLLSWAQIIKNARWAVRTALLYIKGPRERKSFFLLFFSCFIPSVLSTLISLGAIPQSLN